MIQSIILVHCNNPLRQHVTKKPHSYQTTKYLLVFPSTNEQNPFSHQTRQYRCEGTETSYAQQLQCQEAKCLH